jgi:hypothetical protein
MNKDTTSRVVAGLGAVPTAIRPTKGMHFGYSVEKTMLMYSALSASYSATLRPLLSPGCGEPGTATAPRLNDHKPGP